MEFAAAYARAKKQTQVVTASLTCGKYLLSILVKLWCSLERNLYTASLFPNSEESNLRHRLTCSTLYYVQSGCEFEVEYLQRLVKYVRNIALPECVAPSAIAGFPSSTAHAIQ